MFAIPQEGLVAELKSWFEDQDKESPLYIENNFLVEQLELAFSGDRNSMDFLALFFNRSFKHKESYVWAKVEMLVALSVGQSPHTTNVGEKLYFLARENTIQQLYDEAYVGEGVFVDEYISKGLNELDDIAFQIILNIQASRANKL